jgi:hypothetical protein
MPRFPHEVTIITATGAGKGLPRQAHLVFGKTDQHLLEKVFQELGEEQQKRLHDGGKIAAGQGNSKLTLEVQRDNSVLWELSHNALLLGFGWRNNTNTIVEGISFTAEVGICQ